MRLVKVLKTLICGWSICIHFKAKPIGAEHISATVKTFEGFLFEDIMCHNDKVWPQSCRILKPIDASLLLELREI